MDKLAIKINKALEDLLHVNTYDHKSHISIYNPLECFIKYVSTKEIVHSEIIGNLLNPFGQHGLKFEFLKEFLQKIGFLFKEINYCQVDIEYVLHGNKLWDKRRIDILLRVEIDNRSLAIIIENKLNGAGYQPRQLEAYRKAMKELYPTENIYVVCLPLYYMEKPDGANWILYPGDLANLIDTAIDNSSSSESEYIKSYTRYLHNLNISNQVMDNARILASEKVRDENFQVYKSIVDAFAKLPNAYAENLLGILSDNKGLLKIDNPELEEDYPNYVSVWTNTMYHSDNGVWLSIGFNQNSVHYYVVSYQNLVAPQNKGLILANAEKHRKWYRFLDDDEYEMKYEYRPNYNMIIEHIKALINKISKS